MSRKRKLFFISYNKSIIHQNLFPKMAGNWLRSVFWLFMDQGPFLEGPETLSHLENDSKILNLVIAELFYLRIVNMNRGSLHTRSFKRRHFSVFRY